MKPMTMMVLAVLLVGLGGTGCSRKARGHTEDSGEAGHAHEVHEGASGDAHGAKEGRIPLHGIRGLGTMRVPDPRAGEQWVPGEAAGDEVSQALLSSPVKGIVSQLLAIPGQSRGAGSVLALIQSPELARIKAGWITARARMDRVQADLVREERLFQAGAGSRRELEAARSEGESARAEEEAARLGLEAVGLKPGEAGAVLAVKAPAGGSVVAWKVQRGQGVEAGQELGAFQAAQASIVRVELAPPGPSGWKPGAQSEVRSSGQSWGARLEGTPASLTRDTGRLAYRLRLAGGNRPLPGTPVEVKVPLEKGLYLPQAALQQVDGRWGVFVVEGEEAAFRPVRRGMEWKDEVLVLEGLKTGETVVAEGAYLLKAYQRKRTQPEEDGHGH